MKKYAFLAILFMFDFFMAQTLSVSGITNPSAANGTYLQIDNLYGNKAWQHTSGNYYIYKDKYGNDHYWNIDDDTNDNNDVLFYKWDKDSSLTMPPANGYTAMNANTGDPNVQEVTVTITFTDGSSYSPGNATAGTNSNPIGRFKLTASEVGGKLTGATITISGTRSGVTNMKIWSSTDATFNAGDDTELDVNTSTSGATVSFSGFSSAIATAGTYYFVTADLASSASGSLSLTIANNSSLTFTNATLSGTISNAVLSSGAVSITASGPEISIEGNSVEINDGDATPSSSDHTYFGEVDKDNGDITRVFTIKNTGWSTLNLTGTPIVTVDNVAFTVTSQPASSIAVNASSTFSIKFDPSTVGTQTATVTISNDDTNENPYDFKIEGKGISPAALYLDARDFNSLGSFNPTVDVSINMTTGVMSGGESKTGIVSNGILVFSFDSFNLQAGVKISFTNVTDGGNKVAFLSKGDINISGTIDASSANHIPGPGGRQGAYVNKAESGHGAGAGNADPLGDGGAGGAGFGGNGGAGMNNAAYATGGTSYGNLANSLEGGSGGARSEFSNINGYGGGGGGAIQFGALRKFILTGTGIIKANGADGYDAVGADEDGDGAGSGGGILIHAKAIQLQTGSTVSANGGVGGTGGTNVKAGGGGGAGGGRIQLAYHPLGNGDLVQNGTVTANGGAGGPHSDNPGIAGDNGVINWVSDSNVPVGGAEIVIEGNNTEIVDGDTTPSSSDDSDFGKTDLISGQVTHTFTIKNSGGENLTLSNPTLSGTNAADFSITQNPTSPVTPGSSTTFKVTFDPATAGSKVAAISISNNDDDENPYNFNIAGEGVDISAPTTQAMNIVISNKGFTSATISWSNGNGVKRAVFVKETTTGLASPVDDKIYSANTSFGDGEQIGTSGWYCVYSGNGNTVDITNLFPSKTYRIHICEFNENSGLVRYLTSAATLNPINFEIPSIMINEVDSDTESTDTKEFIELFSANGTGYKLDGLVIVLYNGSDEASYQAFDLDGSLTGNKGYFVIGNTLVSGVDKIIADNIIQNGADAVALYKGDAADFPNNTPVTTSNLIDAIVYDTDDADNAGLLNLTPGQQQINENDDGKSSVYSIQRIGNGTGGLRNTSKYQTEPPTPKAKNIAIPQSVSSNASSITSATATLNGTVNPGDTTTVVKFVYGTTTSYGDTVTATESPLTGLTTQNVSKQIVGLMPNTTYHFKVIATNVSGSSSGADKTFTTNAAPPIATTENATLVQENLATLNGKVNPNNSSTTVTFEYGLTVAYGSTVTAVESPVNGYGLQNTKKTISGLTPNTTYHYRVKAVNSAGTTYGADKTFKTTIAFPTVTTANASNISTTSAKLNGVVNANNSSATVRFEYGKTISYGLTVTADESPVSGTTDTDVSKNIVSLEPNTTYHFKVVATNEAGSTHSVDKTFTTNAAPPEATTENATAIEQTSVTLNGKVNPNNSSTTVTFEYGLTTAYGSTTTAAESPINGYGLQNTTKGISGLLPNTTYHYRVKAVNSAGTVYGSDKVFNTAIPLNSSISVRKDNDPIPDNYTEVFPITKINNANCRIFTIKNCGNIDLVINGPLKISGANSKQFKVSQQPQLVIRPDEKSNFTIEFSPDSISDFKAKVEIFSNDKARNPFVINLEGKGKGYPLIRLKTIKKKLEDNDSLNFEIRKINKSVKKCIYIKNTGDEELVLDSLSLKNLILKQFTIEGDWDKKIKSGDSTKVKIKYKATNIGKAKSELVFYSNSDNDETIKIKLFGETYDPRPIIECNDEKMNFNEGDSGKLIFTDFNIKDKDSKHLKESLIYFSENYNKDEDKLMFPQNDSLQVSKNIDKGRYFIKGKIKIKNFKNYISNIKYLNSNKINPIVKQRKIKLYVIDAEGYYSNAIAKEIQVKRINALPQIINLPNEILMKQDSVCNLNMWEYISDEETPDSLLKINLSYDNDSLICKYFNENGNLQICCKQGFYGSVSVRIDVIDEDGGTTKDTTKIIVERTNKVENITIRLPKNYKLSANYPNPFNPVTLIEYSIPKDGFVKLVVYNTLGQVVKVLVSEEQEIGKYKVVFNGSNLPSGIYFYRLSSGKFSKTNKMILMK